MPESVRRVPLPDIAELVGDARVVAIGENNHYIREFTQLRADLVRVLVTELGFSIVGYESGFAEGQLVDRWIRGGPGDVGAVARDGFTFRFGESPQLRELLRGLRQHHAAGGRVRFAGLDLPGSGGSPLPALTRVRDHLAEHAPGELPLVEAAIDATRAYAAANNGAAPARYAQLTPAERDAATTALTRLLLRLDALGPGPVSGAHRIARHHAYGALRLDEQLRELHEFGDRRGLVPSSRDIHQADTVRLLRDLEPDARLVLLLHNAHCQRVPMQLVPGVHAPSTGTYLAAELGSDYVAIGVTALDGTTTTARLADDAPAGLEVLSAPLEPPGEGSVEHAVARSTPGDEPVLLDLRPARGRPGPTSIRHVTTETPVDVLAAFDGLVCLPAMSPALPDHAPRPRPAEDGVQ
ncbi:erythromycin esterase family protein [Prauserella oleivorans]